MSAGLTWHGRYVSTPYMQPNGAVYVERRDVATGDTSAYCSVAYADDFPLAVNSKFALKVRQPKGETECDS